MEPREPGGGPLRLKIASFGDPDLEISGLGRSLPDFIDSRVNYEEEEGPTERGPSEALEQDVEEGAEGAAMFESSLSLLQRQVADKESLDASRNFNLRPRSIRNEAGATSSATGKASADNEELDDEYDSGEEARTATKKRGVGRPRLYDGDPDAPDLSDGERRRVKRRLSNRESARRVREKRQQHMETLDRQIREAHQLNRDMRECIADLEQHKSMLRQQLTLLHQKMADSSNENQQLRSQICSMNSQLQERSRSAEGEAPQRVQSGGLRGSSPLLSGSRSFHQLPLQLQQAPSFGELPRIQPLTTLQGLNSWQSGPVFGSKSRP